MNERKSSGEKKGENPRPSGRRGKKCSGENRERKRGRRITGGGERGGGRRGGGERGAAGAEVPGVAALSSHVPALS